MNAAKDTPPPVIVWFRQDLRLDDNPALDAAAKSGRPVVALYILDDDSPGKWRIGGAGRWWLHHSLKALDASLRKHGGGLVLKRGRASEVLPRLCKGLGARAVFWNRCYEPFAIERDTGLKASLQQAGVEAKSFASALLVEPMRVMTQSGEPYKVYSPFWRACLKAGALRTAEQSEVPKRWAKEPSETLDDWTLTPRKPNWAKGFGDVWTPGEAGARKALSAFLDAGLSGYANGRDMMSEMHTSRLSPHLHWGEISPARVHAALAARMDEKPALQSDADKFLAELGWREFSHYLLYHWPELIERNWRSEFDAFMWRDDEAGFAAWAKGQTGYPVIDAGMRELWVTGYMHNRARMACASFLVKHLLIDWRKGADWFWDTLVDADLANNSASWQWVAGCGADAAPYFRIFNPVAQGEKFDPDGAYVRAWVPEIAALPNGVLHRPWEAHDEALAEAGVVLGESYPKPIVDHKEARERALGVYSDLKDGLKK